MGKFQQSVGGDTQIDQLQEIGAGVDLPTGPSTNEEGAAASSSILDKGIAELEQSEIGGIVEEGINAGLDQEQAVADQREAERVPDIISRRDDEARIDVYDHQGKIAAKAEQAQKANQANDGVDANGGLQARARNLANSFEARELGLGGLGPSGVGAVKGALTSSKALTPEGSVDKGFLQMMSVITENTLATLAFAEGVDNVTYDEITGQDIAVEQTEVDKQGGNPISKAVGNAALGKQINREWQRYKNTQEGISSDEYADLSQEEATILGDVAKELYFEANKGTPGNELLLRGRTDDGKQTVFTLTKHGADLFKKGSTIRKKMFPTQHVKPTKTPTPGGSLVKEGRVYTKKVSSKIKKPIAGAKVLQEAMVNLNTVPNVVDKQRLKILLATSLPVLTGEMAPDTVFAEINGVGKAVFDKFAAKGANDPDFNPEETYENVVSDLAQSIWSIATERNGANYLTYYMQAFNGRIAPQQSLFDPTSSKSVRFVTRNATPSIAKPGSRVEKNLRQMYAMGLVTGKGKFVGPNGKEILVKADSLLPAQREKALEKATPQLVRWGKELKAALDVIPDASIEAAAEAIAQGTPVTDPNFPQVPLVSLKDPELIQAIKDKGADDGQAFIDGVIDFTNYYEAKLKGIPYASYYNAYIDGKTNGLAGNGLQMGSEKVAYKTGVLRSQKETLLDNNEDIRDDLKNMLLQSVADGFEGTVNEDFHGKITSIASKLYSNRDMNKANTMTFGYGMELESMKKVLSDYLDIMIQADPELSQDLQVAVGNDPENRNALNNALHSKYVVGLEQALDPDALASRALMRSAAVLHGITNELFNVRTATGFELNLGGTDTTGYVAGDQYKVWKDGKYHLKTAATYGEESTSAATKRRTDEEGNLTLEPGGVAYGGAVPGPVQSLDAATVGLSASGKSWARLKSASYGNPYLHTIYDAFKLDANGFDVMLEEINNNWLDAAMDWSYLEETKNSIDSLKEKWSSKSSPFSDYDTVPENEFKMAAYLLQPVTTQKGGVYPLNLLNKMKKLIADPEKNFDATNNIIKQMAAVGYNVKSPPATATYKQLKTFVNAIGQELNLSSRLNAMIAKTNAKKKELKAKIKRDGNKVYQYYSH